MISAKPAQLALAIGALSGLATAAGCDDLREFKTKPNEVFRGEVVGSDADTNMDSFIRKGFESHTLLDLTFDPNASAIVTDAGDTPVSAGTVDTYICPDGRSNCDVAARTPGPFTQAPLINLDGLAHDPLSQYTFPGGGRLRNYIFGVRFVSVADERTTGRDAMLFVSLMENGRMEVRAMAPGVFARDSMEERWPALFGVFSLTRTKF